MTCSLVAAELEEKFCKVCFFHVCREDGFDFPAAPITIIAGRVGRIALEHVVRSPVVVNPVFVEIAAEPVLESRKPDLAVHWVARQELHRVQVARPAGGKVAGLGSRPEADVGGAK